MCCIAAISLAQQEYLTAPSCLYGVQAWKGESNTSLLTAVACRSLLLPLMPLLLLESWTREVGGGFGLRVLMRSAS